MSDLRDALDSYLHVRRALGFKLRDAGRKLSDFVTYLEDRGETTITTVAALAWAQQPADAPPGRWAERLSMTRVRQVRPESGPGHADSADASGSGTGGDPRSSTAAPTSSGCSTCRPMLEPPFRGGGVVRR